MLFSSFRCYPVDKLISIIYKLYDEIGLLHPSILKEHVSSSYLIGCSQEYRLLMVDRYIHRNSKSEGLTSQHWNSLFQTPAYSSLLLLGDGTTANRLIPPYINIGGRRTALHISSMNYVDGSRDWSIFFDPLPSINLASDKQ